MKKPLLFVALALCATVCTAPVQAQEVNSGSFMDGVILNNTLMKIRMENNELAPDDSPPRRPIRGSKRPKARRGPSLRDSMALSVRRTKTAGGLRAPLSALRFRPSSSVRQRVLANYVAATRKISPNDAAKLQKSFASQDVFALMGRGMARYGLKTNNVADAMTMYLTVTWLGARGSDADLPKAQMLAVREQMAHALAATPSLVRATSARKQELSDTLLMQALFFDAAVKDAKKRPATMAQTKAAIAQSVRATFGLDLGALKITNQGFRA